MDYAADIEPIPGEPGVNAEADAFNMLLYAIGGDWRLMRDTVSEQDRVTNNKMLMCLLVWFVTLLDNVPTVATALLLHYRKKIIETGEDVWTTRAKAEAEGEIN